jgi:hypothetical protein
VVGAFLDCDLHVENLRCDEVANDTRQF